MASHRFGLASSTALSLLVTLGAAWTPAAAQTTTEEAFELDTIVISAEDQIKQALGASTITSDDLDRQPVVNDLSEIIRRMPGVNLSGTTASGQRGNQRQIDIRGMGPENTLILIDGKPVTSRNAVRMGRAGERDSRGDSNWVPAELVERIEVIRGPAAARYGSGASGGVVNIITKRPTEQTSSLALTYSTPEGGDEGATKRINMMTAGPLGEKLSYRFTVGGNETEADDPQINQSSVDTDLYPAGREGVKNRDYTALVTWDVAPGHSIDFEAGYSRQGNIFTGDTQNSSTDPTDISSYVGEFAQDGAETNVMHRGTAAITHRGTYGFGESFSFLQYEQTRNKRYLEALAGGPEGSITSDQMATIVLETLSAKTEWTLPLNVAGKETSLTFGAEVRHEMKDDSTTLRQAVIDGVELGDTATDPADRDPTQSQTLAGLYVEGNILWNDRLTLTPGLRFDQSSTFGSNWSPSLNATYAFTDEWSMKLGIARAFKAPNLFQLDPNYVYYTMGQGCPAGYGATGGVGCYVVGNEDLDAETSVNKEIGFAYEGFNGVNGSLTYFRNDYKNRIASGLVPLASANPDTGAGWYLQWENTPEAVVAGIEGNLSFPIGDDFAFNTNFTKMTQSKNKQNGQPLSLIPEYTVNASLDWFVTDALVVTTSLTHYGKIEAATVSATTGNATTDQSSRSAYTLVDLGMVYDYNERVKISGGISNLFDKQLFRSNEGANTYNEPGRAFYVSLNTSF